MAQQRKSHSKKNNSKRSKKEKIITAAVSVIIGLLALFVCFGKQFGLDLAQTFKDITASKSFDDNENVTKSNSTFSVHFIDVGQGDSALIQSDGYNILIDGGEKDEFVAVSNYLKAQKVTKLDMIIATHPHSDHMGSFPEVIDTFEIGKVLMPKVADDLVPTSTTYKNFLNSVAKKQLKITPAKAGLSYDFGRGQLEIISPTTDFDDLNNYSIGAIFSYEGKRFFFTGDMEAEAENEVLKSKVDIKADVLKVGHHGSNTSTKAKFLKAVAPSFCVISVGELNSYHHPHPSTIKRIDAGNAKVYRTDYDGNIVFHIVDGELVIETSGKQD